METSQGCGQSLVHAVVSPDSFRTFGTRIAHEVIVRFTSTQGAAMLGWALTFFLIAIVAGIFGFGGIAGEASWIAQILLVVFLILAVVSLITGRRGMRSLE